MSKNDSHEDLLKEILSSIIDEDVMVYDSIIERTGNPYTLEFYDRIPEEYTIHEMLKILAEDGVISLESFNVDDIVSCRKALYSVLYTVLAGKSNGESNEFTFFLKLFPRNAFFPMIRLPHPLFRV